MSLMSVPHIDVTPSNAALTVAVTAGEDPLPIHIGAGQIGPDAKVAILTDASPLPISTPVPWKFGSHGTGAHLIVLDPGHGGSDTGAQQNGLTEKEITLDISQRLRDVLTARGWSVKMTREKDVDVFEPNDSAHDELQARCDIANKAGAQIFVSIHVNSFTSGDLNGTTTYYYKNEDLPLAEAVHRRLVSVLDTKDDGVRKSNFYVIHHTSMPAILIETAFMSNADDAQRLRSVTFLQKIASAVADGVGDYAGKQPPVTGMLEQ
jgi:N-acetylmuramoyl-L-alanine amidase